MRYLLVLILIAFASCSTPSPEGGYRIARDPAFFPLDLGSLEVRVGAFSDDLVRQIAKSEDFEVSFGEVTWEMIPVALRSGRVDGVLTAIPPIPQYRDAFDFSDVYLQIGPVLVVQKESSASSMEGMLGKTVGVVSGTSSVLLVAKVPQVVIREFPTEVRALEALKNGVVDGVVIPTLSAYTFINDLYAKSLKVATPPLTNDGLRLITAKGKYPELIEAFNQGLQQLRDQSKYREMTEKWSLYLHLGPSNN